ncbi:hypothetical protein [Salinispira pacifica]
MRVVEFAVASLLLLASASVAAQEVSVDYVDGELSIRSGTGWVGLMPGSRIAGDSVVRLGEYSVAELTAGTTRVLLSQAGPVDLATVLKLARKNPADKAFGTVGSAINGMLLNSRGGGATSGVASAPSHAPGSGTTMGVRSFDKGLGDDTLEFVDSAGTPEPEQGSDAQRGMTLLADERFAEAARVFDAAASGAQGSERERFLFLAAYAAAAGGNEADALTRLLRISDDRTLISDSAYVLLRGALLMESMRFLDALQLFARHRQSLRGAEPSPDILALEKLGRSAIGQ